MSRFYFDNFVISHERGRIVEENHFYSYGLKIQGISSRAQGSILNKYGYQSDFDSLRFLVTDNRIELNAFVPIAIGMSNHIHLIWQSLSGFTSSDIQASFMKFTAQQLKRSRIKNDVEALYASKVNKYDREYHPDSHREEKGATEY